MARQRLHAAGLVIERDDGRILVLRRHPDDPEGGLLGLVGGEVESGETAKAALLREVQEEIGVSFEPGQLRHVKQYEWSSKELSRQVVFDVFELTEPLASLDVRLDGTESTDFRWEKPADLLERPDLMAGLYSVLRDR